MKALKSLFLPLALFAAIGVGQTKQEFRGLWLTNVDSNVLLFDPAIAQAMDYLASIGVNVIPPASETYIYRMEAIPASGSNRSAVVQAKPMVLIT
jgi:uncharacterized lipoprotein YddW (UPF0748 family)